MIRCVVLDDEPIILRSIKAKIEQHDPRFQVVGIASDGKAGIELIERLRPDVVFTDIRMPVMDGLELIERIRAVGGETTIVILSGHKLFNYAQRAIQLGVEDYLVKPIDPDRLAAVLNKISDQFHHDRVEKFREAAKRAIGRQLDASERDDWNLRLFAEKTAALIGVKICVGPYLAYRFHPGKQNDVNIAGLGLEALCHQLLQKDDLCWVLDENFSNEKLLLFFTGRPRKLLAEALWQKIRERLDARTYVSCIFAGPIRDIGLLPEVVKRLNQALYQQSVFGHSTLLDAEERSAIPTGAAPDCKAQMKALVEAFQQNRAQDCLQFLESILSGCTRTSCTQAELLKLIRTLLRQMLAWDELDVGVMADVLVYSSDTYVELKQNFELLILNQDWLERIDERHELGMEAVVDRIALHIRQHSNERILVQELARRFCISHSYLCTMFKKYIGMAPNEYIISERIARAKDLLASRKDMSIGEVSQKVGYDDPYYFSRIFRSVTGLTPSDYRKKCEEQE